MDLAAGIGARKAGWINNPWTGSVILQRLHIRDRNSRDNRESSHRVGTESAWWWWLRGAGQGRRGTMARGRSEGRPTYSRGERRMETRQGRVRMQAEFRPTTLPPKINQSLSVGPANPSLHYLFFSHHPNAKIMELLSTCGKVSR